ncbi:MAG: chemotaxis protein CheA [Deltaproteobacteria bacterium]|nr:chemotaxis protein CheA [Deltaproteobacteria bacterium]
MNISEYKHLFLSEAREILNSLNNVLVDLEKEPSNTALLNELFRQTHTLKSMAQSMEYEEIAKLTHSMETTLALLRNPGSKAEKDIVDLLFKSLNTLGDLIKEKEKGKTEKVKAAPLVERFEEITSTAGEGQTVRIPLTQLDNLMDMTGELAINRIRLSQIAKTIEDTDLEETVAQLDRLTSQLQNQMMEVRLVPLEYIFAPYPRMVRDIAVAQKKEVDFFIEGGHIGMDRSIQDEINEPLLHLLKNAVIHGIEGPREREKLKKPGRGKIKLSARREKNSVVIELSDDGRGMDIEEVKEAVLETGIITAEELSALSPKEVIMLVTFPGYSRAKKVTEVAGRGMGLSASKAKAESLGGTLDIHTKPNEGTTLSFTLPLTTAVIQAMLVGVADETYCIPLSYLAETMKISPQDIKTMEHYEVISYRDTVLPLIRVREKFGFAPSSPEPPVSDVSPRNAAIPVAVVEARTKKVGLVVDDFLGQQEVVIRPLTGILKEIKGASGATILGTGKPALIMEVGSLL